MPSRSPPPPAGEEEETQSGSEAGDAASRKTERYHASRCEQCGCDLPSALRLCHKCWFNDTNSIHILARLHSKAQKRSQESSPHDITHAEVVIPAGEAAAPEAAAPRMATALIRSGGGAETAAAATGSPAEARTRAIRSAPVIAAQL